MNYASSINFAAIRVLRDGAVSQGEIDAFAALFA